MKGKTLFPILTIALLGVSIIAFSTMQTTWYNGETMDVLIGFDTFINDFSFLERYGVEITYQYKTFPSIAATIPANLFGVIAKMSPVTYIEPDYPVYLLEDSMDWGVDHVEADLVWGGAQGAVNVTTSIAGASVKVAVIDTGIDYTHPDLAAAYAGGYDFVNGDNDPLDDQGHGTHVAGTITALDNGAGLIGVAPKVQLYAVKVLDSAGSGTSSNVAAGIDWAASNGMNIASLSLGSSTASTTIQTAGQNAYAAGVLLVAASGNDGLSSVSYPAAFAEFIAVGATDQNDQLASFSNYGSAQELVAPGVSITSTTPTYSVGSGANAPALNYDTWSGTSMATPHVSGVAALVFSADPTLTNVDVRNILTSSARDLGAAGWDSTYGYGLVDAYAAVNLATGGGGGGSDTTPPAQVTGLTATAVSSSQIDLSWNANTETDLSHYNIYRDGVYLTQTTSTTFSDTGLSASTSYTYEVSAVDTSGNEGLKSSPASATTLAQNAQHTVTRTGTVSSTTVDDYQTVTVLTVGYIDITLSWSTSADLDFYVYAPDGTYIGRAYTLNNPETLRVWTKDYGTGDYTIRVNLYSGSTTDYTLTIEGYEKQDVTGQVSSSTPTVSHYFAMDFTGSSYAVLSWSTSADLDFYVYDESGNYVDRAYTTANPETLSFVVDITGTWRIDVDLYSGVTTDYVLSVYVPAANLQ